MGSVAASLVTSRAVPARLERSVEVAVPVERAWQLVASSEGLSSWLADATVAPGPEGSVTLRFAPGAEGTMPVVVWDPPWRIRFGAAEGLRGRAHDIRVECGNAGGSVVRLTDEGVDDADVQAIAQGWDMMLLRLQEQAAQF
jgi:uncharacterized protein YndB with AHSA1/START domain